MEVTKQEMISYLSSIRNRLNREETKDCQLEMDFGDARYVKTENVKCWQAKQRKIQILDAIINELNKWYYKNVPLAQFIERETYNF